jgi:hypothetical protein
VHDLLLLGDDTCRPFTEADERVVQGDASPLELVDEDGVGGIAVGLDL